MPAITMLLVVLLIVRMCDKEPRKVDVSDHKWDKLLVILDQIEQHYVDSIDYKDIVEKTLPHVMQNLDPHSVYLPPKELEVADESLTGNFSGIGIQFNVPNDTVVVINVVPGGPSERAGLLSGDRIITVDGENIAGVKMDQDSIVKRLKGPRGTTVKIGIKRDDLEELVPFTIKRDNIPVKSVDVSYMIDDSLGYIKLSKFARTSYTEVHEALEKLRGKGVRSLILDLRDNTGGYLDQALLMSNEFLAKGQLIVYMDGLHRQRRDFHADGKGSMQDVKLYVLINENSASSSEIFAGAIQDNDRGTIVGRRSFGKGLVQEPIYFSDKSGIRLTVARFYTPTGRCIQKPYSKDYQYDIIERYQHGEMTVADSIKRNDSLKFVTPAGKVVYGGGGIIPDIFVPIDTAGVTRFLVAVNRKSLQVKYSIKLADTYRAQLRQVKSFEDLEQLTRSIDIESGFLAFAKENGIVPKGDEWQKSKEFIVTQMKGLFGRYTSLDDEAFYPYINRLDNVIERVIEEEKGETEKTETTTK